MLPNDRPPRPSQHSSGDFGERLVAFLLPPEWVIHPYKGTEDYGLDFHVDVFENGQPTGLEFGVQVKTSKTLPARRPINLDLSLNSLRYIASRAYPTMIVLVGRDDQQAVYAWIGDLLTEKLLLTYLSRSVGDRRPARLKAREVAPLVEARAAITHYLRQVKLQFGYGLNEERGRRAILEIYVDVHAALDVLIEFAVMHEDPSPRSSDEISHKITYAFGTVSGAYLALFVFTRLSIKDARSSPALTALLTLQADIRRLMELVLPEPFLSEAEQKWLVGRKGPMLEVLPGSPSRIWMNTPALLQLFRDVLRILVRYVTPWRSTPSMPGVMADLVLEYRDGGPSA